MSKVIIAIIWAFLFFFFFASFAEGVELEVGPSGYCHTDSDCTATSEICVSKYTREDLFNEANYLLIQKSVEAGYQGYCYKPYISVEGSKLYREYTGTQQRCAAGENITINNTVYIDRNVTVTETVEVVREIRTITPLFFVLSFATVLLSVLVTIYLVKGLPFRHRGKKRKGLNKLGFRKKVLDYSVRDLQEVIDEIDSKEHPSIVENERRKKHEEYEKEAMKRYGLK